MIIRNCTWYPLGDSRSVFAGHNDGTHQFGYACYMPHNVSIDGLTIVEDTVDDRVLTIFNDYSGSADIPAEERVYMPVPPVSVSVKNIHTTRKVELCANPELMPDTEFITL